ncbi:MAG: hypothetical protein F4Z21_04885 [Acidobacteria bacterium]|nr:hypothetical protein [Acidobacteriota bacterium]
MQWPEPSLRPTTFPTHMVFRLASIGLLLLTLPGVRTALGEDFSLEEVGHPPEAVAEPLKSILNPAGVRVLNGQGNPWCEIWVRREIADSGRPASPEAVYPGFHSGVLLGLMRFPEDGTDYRGLPVGKGTYTMRYGVIPQDGNHVGAAPIVDFVLLIPLSEDTLAPDAHLSSGELVELSKKASGTHHPTVINLAFPPDSVERPLLENDDSDHWILSLPLNQKAGGQLPLSIIVHGQAAG